MSRAERSIYRETPRRERVLKSDVPVEFYGVVAFWKKVNEIRETRDIKIFPATPADVIDAIDVRGLQYKFDQIPSGARVTDEQSEPGWKKSIRKDETEMLVGYDSTSSKGDMGLCKYTQGERGDVRVYMDLELKGESFSLSYTRDAEERWVSGKAFLNDKDPLEYKEKF